MSEQVLIVEDDRELREMAPGYAKSPFTRPLHPKRFKQVLHAFADARRTIRPTLWEMSWRDFC